MEATKWLFLAGTKRDEEAITILRQLQGRMPEEDFEEGRLRAQAWQGQYRASDEDQQ